MNNATATPSRQSYEGVSVLEKPFELSTPNLVDIQCMAIMSWPWDQKIKDIKCAANMGTQVDISAGLSF